MVNRNATVSASTTSTSKKLKVISRMSYLKRESKIMLTIISSDSAAATAGRRSRMSQKKLRKAQVSSASVVANGPYSVRQTASSAAAWMAAMAATRSAGDAAMTFTPVKRRREPKSLIAITRTLRALFEDVELFQPRHVLLLCSLRAPSYAKFRHADRLLVEPPVRETPRHRSRCGRR